MTKDYYKILQVDPQADPEVLQSAYRRLAQKYHPDIDKSAKSKARMQAINEAYEVLGNTAKRSDYDRTRLAAGKEPAFTPSPPRQDHVTKRASRGKKKQPQRRPRRSRVQRMGGWLPVAVVGAGAVAMAIVAIAVTHGGGSSTNVPIPTRTVAAQGRTLGPDNARVTVEEYSDFQCPYCARAARTMDPRIQQDYVADGRVRLVFQPVALIGEESIWAAEAAECANEQGKFWDYHDKLFENQHGENQGAFSMDNLKRFASELGLDTQTFNQCLDSGKYQDLIKAETQDAVDKGIESTPTFIIGDQTVAGPGSYDDLKTVIEAELRKNP